MPAGDIFDIVVKILAILATPLAGLAVWALTRHVRLTHLQAEHEKLRQEKESLEGKLEETRRAGNELRQASADRYDKLRAAYHEARDKFYRIKAAAHSLRRSTKPSASDRPIALTCPLPKKCRAACKKSWMPPASNLASCNNELKKSRARTVESG